MKIRRRKKMHSSIEASSLSDILFFLMLFFLMVSTMASPEAIKILLPKASTGSSIPKHALNVTIDNKLNWYVEQRPVNEETIKEAISKEAALYGNDVTVILRADKGIAVEELIKVVDVINILRLPLVVATQKSS